MGPLAMGPAAQTIRRIGHHPDVASGAGLDFEWTPRQLRLAPSSRVAVEHPSRRTEKEAGHQGVGKDFQRECEGQQAEVSDYCDYRYRSFPDVSHMLMIGPGSGNH